MRSCVSPREQSISYSYSLLALSSLLPFMVVCSFPTDNQLPASTSDKHRFKSVLTWQASSSFRAIRFLGPCHTSVHAGWVVGRGPQKQCSQTALRRQAGFSSPLSSARYHNPHGTAPGLAILNVVSDLRAHLPVLHLGGLLPGGAV